MRINKTNKNKKKTMNNILREALQSAATFNLTNDTDHAVKLAFLPGIYDAKDSAGAQTSPNNLINAGYSVDQVAADYNVKQEKTDVHLTGVGRVRYEDFLNTVRRVGIRVQRIVIQNKNTTSQDIFDQEIEVARTAVGTQGAKDFIQLQDYVDTNAYDRTKITIDLSNQVLYLGPETFMAMNIPAGARFSIKFVFEA